ncbi:hypothetical protein ABGA94_10005, partial [Stenotrophomonas sp. 3diitr2024]
FGKGSVMRMGDRVVEPVEAIPTGSLMLDIALGIGGLPKGSKIYGAYGGGPMGKRVEVIWDRITTPNGIDVAETTVGVFVGHAALDHQILEFLAGLQRGHQLLLQREL